MDIIVAGAVCIVNDTIRSFNFFHLLSSILGSGEHFFFLLSLEVNITFILNHCQSYKCDGGHNSLSLCIPLPIIYWTSLFVRVVTPCLYFLPREQSLQFSVLISGVSSVSALAAGKSQTRPPRPPAGSCEVWRYDCDCDYVTVWLCDYAGVTVCLVMSGWSPPSTSCCSWWPPCRASAQATPASPRWAGTPQSANSWSPSAPAPAWRSRPPALTCSASWTVRPRSRG